MQGMFRANGGCGYVKKPDFLMNVDANGERANLTVKKRLKVNIIQTSTDSHPSHHPFIESSLSST